MLISETDFTETSQQYGLSYEPSSPNCSRWYCYNHKICIKHHQLNIYSQIFLQATGVSVEDSFGLLTISAVYLPPRHRIKQELFLDFYNTLGRLFIEGGNYNAKHTDWGFRLDSFNGRHLLKMMESNNLKRLSTGESTYWPSDRNKLHCRILWTSVLRRAFLKTSLSQHRVSTYPPDIPRS
jgi:hypothetical protein